MWRDSFNGLGWKVKLLVLHQKTGTVMCIYMFRDDKCLRYSCNSLLQVLALMDFLKSSYIRKEIFCYFKIDNFRKTCNTTLFKISFHSSFEDATLLWNALPFVLTSNMLSLF